MNSSDSSRKTASLVYFGVAALFAVTAATAQVASGTTGIDASGNYQQEVNACMTGRTQQDQATCLKEARNAQADKKRGVLDTDGSPRANALARCDVLPNDERMGCIASVQGLGNTSGSVAGGGVLRETETVVLPRDGSPVVVAPLTSGPLVVVPSTN